MRSIDDSPVRDTVPSATTMLPPLLPAAARRSVALVFSPIDAEVFRSGKSLGGMPVTIPIDPEVTSPSRIRREGFYPETVKLDGSRSVVVVRLGAIPGVEPRIPVAVGRAAGRAATGRSGRGEARCRAARRRAQPAPRTHGTADAGAPKVVDESLPLPAPPGAGTPPAPVPHPRRPRRAQRRRRPLPPRAHRRRAHPRRAFRRLRPRTVRRHHTRQSPARRAPSRPRRPRQRYPRASRPRSRAQCAALKRRAGRQPNATARSALLISRSGRRPSPIARFPGP